MEQAGSSDFLKKHHYFNNDLSKGFKCLLTNRMVTNFAAGFFTVFLPIFLYEIFNKSLVWVAGYYLSTYAISLFLVFFVSRDLNNFGFKKALKTSTLIGAIYYLSIFLLKEDNVFYIIPITAFSIALWRFLYWIPYNIDFAKFTSSKDRGKGLGFIRAMINLVGIVTPFLAGFIISNFGFNVLFLIGVLFFLASYFTLVKIPRTKEKFSWSGKVFFKKLLDKKNRKLALLFFFDGAEPIIAVFVWPIFIYELLQGNYLEIGLISSLVVLVTVFLQLLAGKLVDKKSSRVLKAGGFFYAAGWFLKVFAATALHVFVFDAFHQFMKVFYRIPLDTLVFETAFKQKHKIDEFNVFRQIWLFSGRIVMSLIIILVAFFTNSINFIFFFGVAIVVLISIFYKKIQNSTI